MSSLNKVMLIGRLGKDPEIRYTANGTAVCNFSLATSERYKDKSGDKQEKTEWHNIVVWGKLSEVCAEYLSKGSLVYLGGSLQTRKWEDKNGNTRYTTEVRATEMQILGSKSESKGGGEDFDDDFGLDDDDIPF